MANDLNKRIPMCQMKINNQSNKLFNLVLNTCDRTLFTLAPIHMHMASTSQGIRNSQNFDSFLSKPFDIKLALIVSIFMRPAILLKHIDIKSML